MTDRHLITHLRHVDIAVPDSAGLSQQQVLELAASVDIRRTTPHAVG